MPPLAYVYQRDDYAMHLATVYPTRENTYTPLDGKFVVAGLGFHWQAPLLCWQTQYWAWRRPLDHRMARGKYLHRHKGKALKSHPLHTVKALPKPLWSFGMRPPTTPGYITRPLFLIAQDHIP